jgi:hypothetical protein
MSKYEVRSGPPSLIVITKACSQNTQRILIFAPFGPEESATTLVLGVTIKEVSTPRIDKTISLSINLRHTRSSELLSHSGKLIRLFIKIDNSPSDCSSTRGRYVGMASKSCKDHCPSSPC